jgi:Ca-activated chloride channel family protein
MNEHDIAKTLARLQAPAPDPQARLRAKHAALAEFARAHAANQPHLQGRFQALWRRLRPSPETNSGSSSMNWLMNRGLMAGAAGVCVLALGVALVWPNLSRDIEDVGGVPAVRAEERTALIGSEEKPPVEIADAPTPEPVVPQEQQGLRAVEVRPLQAADGNVAAAPAASQAPLDQGITSAPAVPPTELTNNGMLESLQNAREVRREAVGVADSIQAADASATMPNAKAARYVGAGVHSEIDSPATMPTEQESRDRFQNFESNPIRRVDEHPVSTFSADVDTASYSFVRSLLRAGRLPPKDSVRAEEMINYFDYAWPAADSRRVPFKPTVVVSDSPWNAGKKLVHIGIKGLQIDRREAPDANLVLLLDVSGSMNQPNRLPLAVRSMELLLESLKPTDTVGIVVYAGAAGTVLEPTPVRDSDRILAALRSLRPGGSTAGAEGIERAYELAERHFRKGGVNRILLATDGDFNVGIHDTNELKGFVERKREKGVYLSVLGFGQGNYRDELAQALAQNGNGVAAYIDTENEARKVLVQEASGSLFTIAKDVKLQVEFNPDTVAEYRLVGYETRALRREDFNNDAVDAGDVGAGHAVTAIYEITPVGGRSSVDAPRYEGNRRRPASNESGRGSELGFLKIRYKLPDEKESRLLSEPIPVRSGNLAAPVARDVAFSTAVAGFAQLLRGGAFTGPLTYEDVMSQAQAARGEDRFGHRAEFIELVRRAQAARGM